jgi:hypothetical protein
LVPTLKPGDIVVMDNLAAHNRDEVAEFIAAAGAELRFLPPYSLPICERHRSARSTISGVVSASCLTSSNPPNAPPTSSTPATLELERIPL